MIQKIFLMFCMLFLIILSAQSEKYNFEIVDGKYKIDDLNEFITVFKKALKEKDNDTILKLSYQQIAYDDENFKGHRGSTKQTLESGFNYDLCLRVLNNEFEITGNEKKMQVYFPKFKRNVDEKYTIMLEKWYNTGWLFQGLLSIPYEYKPDLNKTPVKKYSPTIDNLRFRETPGQDGKYIRTLNKGEKLELLEKGKEETVNGVKGTWVKVKTEKGEVGWCFDAYLEEVK